MSKRSDDNMKGPACCPDIGSLIEPRFFKALCDPNRIALVARLAQCGRACTVTQMAECCPINLSVVSRHLAMLRDAGILSAEKRGKEVYYSLDFSGLVGTLRSVADAIETCCPPGGGEPNPQQRTSKTTA